MIVNTVRTTLGPCGMDKLVYNERSVTISNDGATVMKLLDIVHPAARALVDISISQDSEVDAVLGFYSNVRLETVQLRLSFLLVNSFPLPRLALRKVCITFLYPISKVFKKVSTLEW
jgi:hypothetical protein